MNVGEADYAERRALQLFDDWNEATGVFIPRCGYYFEAVACIEDAVHCGIQMALNKQINIKDGELIKTDFEEGEALIDELERTIENLQEKLAVYEHKNA